MGSRRFTRLTNAFSKKLENHAHAVALHYTHYNWCRIHKSLRPQWWANERRPTHDHSMAWLTAGLKAKPDLFHRTVTFSN